VAKTKELKKRSGGNRESFSSVLEAVSRVSGSPFSAVSDLRPGSSWDTQTFGLDAEDCERVEGAPPFRPLALQYARSLLTSSSHVASAVALTLHFQLDELATVDTLRVLVGCAPSPAHRVPTLAGCLVDPPLKGRSQAIGICSLVPWCMRDVKGKHTRVYLLSAFLRAKYPIDKRERSGFPQ